MRDFEGELVALIDALIVDGISECLDFGCKEARCVGPLFDEIEELKGMFTCCVNVEVSPHARSEPWSVDVSVYGGREMTYVVWRQLWEEGEDEMTPGEAAASCEAELRRDFPSLFGAYDALREQIELEFDAPAGVHAPGAKRL